MESVRQGEGDPGLASLPLKCGLAHSRQPPYHSLHWAARGGRLVLYFCCTSLDHAEAIERDGFQEDASIRVTDQLPKFAGRGADESHAVIFLGVASDFDFDR